MEPTINLTWPGKARKEIKQKKIVTANKGMDCPNYVIKGPSGVALSSDSPVPSKNLFIYLWLFRNYFLF